MRKTGGGIIIDKNKMKKGLDEYILEIVKGFLESK